MGLMRAMLLEKPRTLLKLVDISIPAPLENQVLIKIEACAICRTDLHIIDGELPHPHLPLILGHQIVGRIVQIGSQVKNLEIGQRVGVPWLGQSCGHCSYCQQGQENLCSNALFMGYQLNGGFADYCVAYAAFIFPIPNGYSSLQAAPLLCGGLIGYRALQLARPAHRIGFYGFGSAAHILIQIILYQGGEVFAFTRPGDVEGQAFAKQLGVAWAGDSDILPPIPLDAAIIFAPVGSLVPLALKAVRPGGVVVCAGIFMSDIPSFPYALLYEEKVLRSVTNLTRRDGEEFFVLAPQIPISTTIKVYPLEQTNQALEDLRHGNFHGSAVIAIDPQIT